MAAEDRVRPVQETPEQAASATAANVVSPRVESLTGLRWWAAFFVFTHHMGNLAPLPIREFLKLGTSGVTFFFVLSGFVLTWSARPGTSAGTFYRRRFARIVPAHVVALIPALFVFYRFDPPENLFWIKPVAMTAIVLSLFLLNGWSNDPDILYGGNPASWTLSIEAFFYAFFPFLYRVTARMKLIGALVLAAAALAIAAAYRLTQYHWAELPTLPPPLLHTVAFLVGVALAIALRSGWTTRLPAWLGYVAIGAGLLVLTYTFRHPGKVPFGTEISLLQKEILTLLYGFLILVVAARDLRGGRSLLRSKPLVALGQWSYSFYLVHATILYGIRELHGSAEAVSWANLTWYAGVGAVSILASWLLYRFVEHPLELKLRGSRSRITT
ncbi:acyltransferase [Kribbella sandramycini]|uniref:Acyltransferase n=1 Tax=Kribbella sandramycini TaxID=60450 RepID=A0A7Y4L5W8_9ACTN|nr:acyltransferase [Kribbella sandramycini]MBB6565983.1 peptidoglycan/LPS O-acetylase OafA/YrhL [Kribbella sandramycini]NOL44985.1 acyltransferase [Kribbella sandramycini]